MSAHMRFNAYFAGSALLALASADDGHAIPLLTNGDFETGNLRVTVGNPIKQLTLKDRIRKHAGKDVHRPQRLLAPQLTV